MERQATSGYHLIDRPLVRSVHNSIWEIPEYTHRRTRSGILPDVFWRPIEFRQAGCLTFYEGLLIVNCRSLEFESIA